MTWVAAHMAPLAALGSGTIGVGGALVAVVVAAVGLGYARTASVAARDAAAEARRTVEAAEAARQAAERARVRQRIERVGELVEAVYVGAQANLDAPVLTPWTTAQINVLNQALVGLRRTLPKTAALRGATTPRQLAERAAGAMLEVDAVLNRFARGRMVYRHRSVRGRTGRRARR